jgi:hypothetical protein
MTPDQFYNELVNEFPTLKKELETWDSDSTHFKMEEFAVYTKNRILANDLSELEKCFQFQEQRIELADDNLINCMTVSYCESLLLGGLETRIEKAISLMGPRLLKLYRDYENYYNELGRRSQQI